MNAHILYRNLARIVAKLPSLLHSTAVNKWILSIGVLGVMAAFAVTDALFVAEPLPFIAKLTGQTATGSGTVVQKQESINVLDAIAELDMEAKTTSEDFFLPALLEDTTVQTRAIVGNNDRLGSIAWVESSEVKAYYQALKQALHKNFTGDVADLKDQTSREPDEPVRNQLTFYDPGISSQRLLFLRVRDRLYEVRIELGSEEQIQPLVDELSQ